jgi:hypothetical protein
VGVFGQECGRLAIAAGLDRIPAGTPVLAGDGEPPEISTPGRRPLVLAAKEE